MGRVAVVWNGWGYAPVEQPLMIWATAGPPVKQLIVAKYMSALTKNGMPGAAQARIMIRAALSAAFPAKAVVVI